MCRILFWLVREVLGYDVMNENGQSICLHKDNSVTSVLYPSSPNLRVRQPFIGLGPWLQKYTSEAFHNLGIPFQRSYKGRGKVSPKPSRGWTHFWLGVTMQPPPNVPLPGFKELIRTKWSVIRPKRVLD